MNRETIERTLNKAKSVLAVLEEQAAGYTYLTIPAHLKVELDQKRRDVASLQAKLNQLDDVGFTPQPPLLRGE
jgi:hypothetical protein